MFKASLTGQLGAPAVSNVEQEVRRVSRQSLVLRRGLAADEALREEDLTVQRPGTGIPAANITTTVGRRARQSLPAGTLLQWDMLGLPLRPGQALRWVVRDALYQ